MDTGHIYCDDGVTSYIFCLILLNFFMVIQLQKRKLKISMLVLLILVSISTQGQNLIQGIVTSSEDGSSIPGATIMVEGSGTGTTTDFDGKFSLKAAEDAALVISFIGFKSQRVLVNNQTQFDISLEIDVQSLEEVVVVGYGTVKKSDLTGSVSSVKSAEITAFPMISATQALQGRAAGLQIQSNNGGEPGADLNIRIRGTSSVNAGGDPLIVVDGFIGAEMPPPEDIASIEVLKDASSTAIYGSRASNGVIMVTTKRGKEGVVKINLNTSYSIQSPSNKLDLLSGEEFADYFQEFGDYTYQGYNTDWQDAIFRDGFISNNQISVSGGNDVAKFYVSGTYFDQQGVLLGSRHDRFSINSNVDIKANNWLKIGTSVYARRSNIEGVKTQEGTAGAGGSGVVGAALRFTPDLPIYEDDGSLSRSTMGGALLDNPYALATEYQRERVTDRFQTNNYLEFNLTDWLTFKSTLGLTTNNWREGEFYPTTLIFGESVDGVAGIDTRKNSAVLTENYFTINKTWNRHSINWVNGFSFQKDRWESWDTSNTGFITNGGSFWALEQGSNPGTPTSSLTERVIKSFYSRVNYSLNNKYKFTFTGRYDGSSAFAANNKWAFFPSGAFAWNISEEEFIPSDGVVNDIKLRTSYGLTGNPSIGPYQSLAELRSWYSIVEGENAMVLRDLENADLTWETSAQLDIGLDIGLLHGRINVAADYYDQRTTDLLFSRPVPTYVGNTSGAQLANIGEVNNKGFELTINTKNAVGEFTWSSDIIYSLNRNEVMTLPDSVLLYGESPGHFLLNDDTQLLLEGQPIGVFYGYVYDGIYQVGDAIIPGSGFESDPGGEKYKDISGPDGVPDGVLDAHDRQIIGDPNPDFMWSFNNTFTYKGFDLNIFFMGVHGQDMVSFTLMELERLSGANNTTTIALDRWSPSNPNTDVPSANSSRSYKMSDRFIYDASFVRLKNVTLGYNFPTEILDKIGLSKFRVYVSAQNLLTFTNYPGLDPEVGYQNSGNNSDGNKNIGLDYGGYPNIRSFTFGLNIGF